MGSLDTEVRRELGRFLRELRHREGLTLAELSRAVGVSQSALSQFENGRSEPALGTLWELGRVLNASLFDFFARQQSEVLEVTREGERTVIEDERSRHEAVTRSARRRLDLFVLRLRPGAGPVRDAVAHAGEECGLVLEGSIDVTVGEETHRLGPGDGIWFLSSQPHTFTVVGDQECVSVWADTLADHAPDRSAAMPVVAGQPADPPVPR